MDKNSIIERNNSGVVSNEIDGEVIMVNIDMGKYYGLDEIGTIIWAMLENPVKIESIIEKLAEEYSGERDKIERDVLKFLEKLEKERIIKIVS